MKGVFGLAGVSISTDDRQDASLRQIKAWVNNHFPVKIRGGGL